MKTAAYGTWSSPITADLLAKSQRRLRALQVDADDIYWLENNVQQGGRSILMRSRSLGSPQAVLPHDYSVRSRVHEYGGGDYLVKHGKIIFANESDQAWYFSDGIQVRRISPKHEDSRTRYADPTWFENKIILVRESHLDGDVISELVMIDMEQPNYVQLVASGADFYSSPRFNHDGTKLCWVQWNHPNMPWDESSLWVAKLASDAHVTRIEKKFHATGVAVMQPLWSPSDELFCVTDTSGYGNLARITDNGLETMYARQSEFACLPWIFATQSYCFLDSDRILAIETIDACERLVLIDIRDRKASLVTSDYNTFSHFCYSYLQGAAVIASQSTAAPAVVYLPFDTTDITILRSDADMPLDEDDISVAKSIKFSGSNDLETQAFYYAPKNQQYQGLENSLPPLIVMAHGGPTAHANSALQLKIQFFTSRGFAVVEVNYGGSSGFGRAYRQRLSRQWGIVDVEDCERAATFLADAGWVDPNQTVIMGSSAGGYTVLAAMTTSRQFSAGISLYGIADLSQLMKTTHKFESHYTQQLIDAWPDEQAVYHARSPLHNVKNIFSPVLLLQGGEDKVVPAEQADMMATVLDQEKKCHCHIVYPEEGHGFRQADNIIHCYNSIVVFLQIVLQIECDASEQMLPIKHLP